LTVEPWRSTAPRYVPSTQGGGPPEPASGRGYGPGPAGTAGGQARSAGGPGAAHPAGSGLLRPGRPDVALPPGAMPMRQGSRPLKRWCYVGLFGAEVMLCAANAWVGAVPQSFWAVWDRRAGVLDTETRTPGLRRIRVDPKSVEVRSATTRLELAVSPVGEPVEVVSPHGRSYIWTRKTPIRADGHLTLGMEVRPLSGLGILDESAGYHARETSWEWSAGVGTTIDGWPVAWNLVRGVHDSDTSSERTVWVQGRPLEAPPVRFSADLDELWGIDGSVLSFREEATRARRENLGIVRSDYVQPFGRFRGTIPGGVELSDHDPAFGVMERHSARW
jgi:hypothetical protein